MIPPDDLARDRAATWRVIGTDPADAEKDNCWLAPSVMSHLNEFKAHIQTLQVLVDAVKRVRAEKRAFLEGIHLAELGGPMPDSEGLSEADTALFAALDKLGV